MHKIKGYDQGDYYEIYQSQVQEATDTQTANMEEDYYFQGSMKGAKVELFVTEAKTLRFLLIVREEFVVPLLELASEHAELGMLGKCFHFLDEFIQFRIDMFEKLHPIR